MKENRNETGFSEESKNEKGFVQDDGNEARFAEDNPYRKLNNVGQAERILQEMEVQGGEDIYSQNMEKLMYELADALLMPNKQICGDADDFHNFSIMILKIASDYETAFEIVEVGLKVHSSDTDLLADAIRYTRNCGKETESRDYYGRLLEIDYSQWTWRAFSFVIDYLLDGFGDGNSTYDKQLELVQQYQKYYPYEEDAYYSEYEIYNQNNEDQKAVGILKSVVEKMKFCPKCWMRYADIMIDRGEYEEARKYIRCLRIYPHSSDSVNMAHVYYLDGLCRSIAVLSQEDFNEIEVKNIYKVLNMALSHSSCRKNIRMKIEDLFATMKMETGIDNSY